MVLTTKYPGTLASEIGYYDQYGNARERHWINLNNLKNDDSNVAQCGDQTIASNAGTIHKPARIRTTNYGFNIHENAKINSIRAEWDEYVRNPTGGTTGNIIIPSKGITILNGLAGSNTAVKTESSQVPSAKTARTMTFSGSEISGTKPSHINNSGLGIFFNPAINQSGNTGRMYAGYIRMRVDFDMPTYALSGSITQDPILGDEVTYQLVITNTNNANRDVGVPVTISLPAGLTVKSSSGHGTFNTGNNKWTAQIQSNGSATLTLILNTTSTGNKTITASIDSVTSHDSVTHDFNTSLSRSTNVQAATYTLSSSLGGSVTAGQDITFTVEVSTNSPSITSKNVEVPVIPGFTFKSSSGAGSYNSGTGIWSAAFTNKTSSRTFVMTAVSAGDKTHTITVDDTTLNRTVTVISASITEVFWASIPLSEQVKKYLVPGFSYSIMATVRYTDTVLGAVYEGAFNHRLFLRKNGVKVQDGSRWSYNSLTRRGINLIDYDPTATYEIGFNGNYFEISPETGQIEILALEVKTLGWTNTYSLPGYLVDDPQLLLVNTEYAIVNVPANEKMNITYLSGMNWAGHENAPDLIIKGISIQGDIDIPVNVGLNIILKNGTEHKETSTIIPATQNTFQLGGPHDKWGLQHIDLANLEVGIQIQNLTSSGIQAKIKNIEVILHYQYDETGGNRGFTAKGEHSRNHNLFLDMELDKSEGLVLEIETLDLNQTAGELVTGSTVKAKIIKGVKFTCFGEDLEDAQERLKEATKWLTNEINEFGLPIPYPLVFDHDPGREYQVILHEEISATPNFDEFECEMEFLLPSGVAFSPPKLTGAIGRNNGLVPVTPVITILCLGASSIWLYESHSYQSLTIDHQFQDGTILIIDCNERTIKTGNGEDYTDKRTLDSDWFEFRRDYDFSDSEGCIIQSITYQEGE